MKKPMKPKAGSAKPSGEPLSKVGVASKTPMAHAKVDTHKAVPAAGQPKMHPHKNLGKWLHAKKGKKA